MGNTLSYHETAERPTSELWLLDKSGALIDFSGAYTWVLKIGIPGSTGVVTKTSGITGAAGSGCEPDGTPNVVIDWNPGELEVVPRKDYKWQLTATLPGSVDRVFEGNFIVKRVIL